MNRGRPAHPLLPPLSTVYRSGVELDPDGGVVAGMRPTTRKLIESSRSERRRQRRAQQEMVDPESSIPRECISEIFPEGIDPLVGLEVSQSIRPTLRDKLRIGRSHFWPKESVVAPSIRSVDVQVCRHDIEVADQCDRCIEIDQFSGVGRKAFKPAEFVIELRAGRRVAIREVEAADDNAVYDRFDIPAVGIVRITR